MTAIEYPRLGEKVFRRRLDNGLEVAVVSKPHYAKSYAMFAVRYGGMDLRFQLDGIWRDTPAGIAHYLEHKMFDTEEGNALQELAKNGAVDNAFTSNSVTAYYVQCTEKFYENLRILLHFVSVPYFTQESVEKEQGIIAQEIRMVEDDPDNQVFYALMESLFDHHPIQVSIAGTQESISHITADTLYACHKAFYTPSNMVLTVAGDVDPERVVEIAREILPKDPGGRIERDYGGKETGTAASSGKELRMEVSTPIFQLGFKADPAENGPERLRLQLLGTLACEALLGNSSPLYAKLYRLGLINKNFGYGVEYYPGCALLAAGGESRDPAAVREAVLDEAARIAREGVDESLFNRLKKGMYGARVQGLNSFENLCIELAQGHFAGFEFLSFPQAFESIQRRHVEEYLKAVVTPERCALAVVRPKEGA